MLRERIIVVDLAGQVARVGVAVSDSPTVEILEDLAVPWSVAIRLEQDTIHTLAGAALEGLSEDERTLIFDDLHGDLPRIEDVELQSQIMSGFWKALCRSLTEHGSIGPPGRVLGYIVPPHLYPLPLLERFRETCGEEYGVRLVGFSHEASSLILGLIRSELFTELAAEMDFSTTVTLCAVVACGDRQVDVACFDYSVESEARHRILIRDFFHTTCADLFNRLESCDWLGAISALISLEAPTISEQAHTKLDTPLSAVSVDLLRKCYRTADAWKLKITGGAYVAHCSMGRLSTPDEYIIETAYHIGLQVDQQHFHPLITKEELLRIGNFPYRAAQVFNIKGKPGSEMRINLYCGYSDQVAESILLGHSIISREVLDRLSGSNAAMTGTIRLDAAGSGEFALGVWPDEHVTNLIPFTLPGLVI